MTPSIGANAFALRQTADSKFSHFNGTFDDVVAIAAEHFAKGVPAPGREGVLIVPIPADGFFSGVVEVTPETSLKATFEARRRGEEPYLHVTAVGAPKLPARHVELVLYSHAALAGDASTQADWELVSINARPTEEEEPPSPMAMARNFLNLPGGTPASYTAEEFARAIVYWSRRANCG